MSVRGGVEGSMKEGGTLPAILKGVSLGNCNPATVAKRILAKGSLNLVRKFLFGKQDIMMLHQAFALKILLSLNNCGRTYICIQHVHLQHNLLDF